MNELLVERIRACCRENPNIRSITNLEVALNFGNGSIGKWAKSEKLPPYDRLIKVASALGVSISYLTGEDQKKEAHTTEKDGEHKNEAIDYAFFRVMQDAKDRGYTPEDLQMAIDFLDRARRRDQK